MITSYPRIRNCSIHVQLQQHSDENGDAPDSIPLRRVWKPYSHELLVVVVAVVVAVVVVAVTVVVAVVVRMLC